ncbi:receptor-like protein 33 [Salvia miltiorrhiza]|uniref:receptor-like protein 33 n=1 Tax=Salvia miltiorrhiza TaxID=226208 RepID=UPI0025ACAA22|nr:receptor-like protein 33 [Salvia miltiorrhiza]
MRRKHMIVANGTAWNVMALAALSPWASPTTPSPAESIPTSIHRLTNLRRLYLGYAGFIGPIPSTLSNLTNLIELELTGNFLTGSLPSFYMCSKLEFIGLRDNNLIGSVEHLHFEGLISLSLLDLSGNSLSGSVPHQLFTLPSIHALYLSNNRFNGKIEEFTIVNVSNLAELDLSGNRIEGSIPNSFFQLRSLNSLRLSHNLFNGSFQLQKIQNLRRLTGLDLSYNNLSVETTNMSSIPQLTSLSLSSCNLHGFPNLTSQSSLYDLDLSNNRIGGDIPSWIWELGIGMLNLSLNLLTDLQKPYRIPSFRLLDLHSNQLYELPLLPVSFNSLLLGNNSLTGVIPASICNASDITVLDLSSNNLSGTIPPCLLKKNVVSEVLDLRGNNIDGVIPDQFSSECQLKTFDVSHNKLGGKIPKSLANCKELVVMDVGNNNLDDGFPCTLPLSLQVLVLRSNRFHGDLRCHQSWPNLQILDISSNNFSGTLDPLNFTSWRGMMMLERVRAGRQSFLESVYSYYRNELTLTIKGLEVKLVKIWPDFTSIDLSCNHFEGEIPDAIGNLNSLYLLNLSHNALTGAIPRSLGGLTGLGSLDLSANQLRGRIPEELAKLTFLSVLNVSHNDITGMIPTGTQFQTFSADSFEGNNGLCGFPLNRSCSNTSHGSGSTPSKSKHEEIEWEYVFVALGYVVGLGSIVWTFLCCRRLRERYFEKIEEVVDEILDRKARRRRVERRNEVRRRHQRV